MSKPRYISNENYNYILGELKAFESIVKKFKSGKSQSFSSKGMRYLNNIISDEFDLSCVFNLLDDKTAGKVIMALSEIAFWESESQTSGIEDSKIAKRISQQLIKSAKLFEDSYLVENNISQHMYMQSLKVVMDSGIMKNSYPFTITIEDELEPINFNNSAQNYLKKQAIPISVILKDIADILEKSQYEEKKSIIRKVNAKNSRRTFAIKLLFSILSNSNVMKSKIVTIIYDLLFFVLDDIEVSEDHIRKAIE